uniref:Uncharacterized protein n=1 Tax=viral metagenome TaxID=1070528 RepID=A0A6H1ZRX0_9ZZZZ
MCYPITDLAIDEILFFDGKWCQKTGDFRKHALIAIEFYCR